MFFETRTLIRCFDAGTTWLFATGQFAIVQSCYDCRPVERLAAHRAGTSCFSTWRTWRVALITVSGLRLIDSMPIRTKNSAMSG